jgi:hypothetical protein
MIPESMASYESRLGTIAQAQARAALESQSDALALAAAGVVVWREESRFRLDVHAGTRRGDHGRAICMGSIHPWAPDWATLAGTDAEATYRCAVRTQQSLRSGLAMCAKGRADRWAYAFEYYALGHCAEPGKESRKRAAMQAGLESRLWRNIPHGLAVQ